MMKDFSVKFKNYKCFGEEFQGFERILPINIIVGRNNSGKSSLLDLVKYAIKPYDLKPLAHKNEDPQVLLSFPLAEDDVKKVFKPGAHDNGFPPTMDHWSLGRELVGRILTVQLKPDGSAVFVELSKSLPPYATAFQGHFASTLNNPFRHKSFKHLRAERDIHPEPDDNRRVDENGSGATTIIQQFVNKASLPSQLVEWTLLEELNKIMQPDASFTDIVVQQLEGGCWEIYLEEEEKGRIALSQSGSGLKTILLVLIFLHLVPIKEKQSLDNYLFGFEELENNVHPALQRRLFLYLRDVALTHNTHFFITTHSNVVIDLFSSDPDAQLIHTTHDGKKASVRRVEAYVQRQGILDDLDVRASDLLQSNGVVWVEGPSDRLYFNRWVEVWSDGELREGAHYQCLFYGGRLLSHLSAEVSEQEENELIRILLINRNAIIMLDSDKRYKAHPLNSTKKRIQREFENISAVCWVTKGREVENYIPQNAIAAFYEKGAAKQVGPYESFSDYLNDIKRGEGEGFLSKKVLFAEKIRSYLNKGNLGTVLDLGEWLDEVCASIKKWNALS
ncbi:MAG: AAA family ATPase [Sedimentisphaerales bacterium]